MFDEKHALLEVIKAIEELRETHGTTSKQICDFVRKRSKNTNDPIKAFKTARKLNQLVDEGVLVKRGRRYKLPNSHTEKKLEAGDRNTVLENTVEFEDEAADEDWLLSDEENFRVKASSTNKKPLPKRSRKRNGRKSGRRKFVEVDSSLNKSKRDDRSRSPIKNRNPSHDDLMIQSRDESEREIVDSRENDSTNQGATDDNSSFSENHCLESSNIPALSNLQVPNVNRKYSCSDNDGEQQSLEADKEEEILMKIKHERETHRKPPSHRSSSKARKRRSKKKERDEFIEKGRTEKLNGRSFSHELDSLNPE